MNKYCWRLYTKNYVQVHQHIRRSLMKLKNAMRKDIFSSAQIYNTQRSSHYTEYYGVVQSEK